MVEFCFITTWRDKNARGESIKMDAEYVEEMEAELKKMGVI